MSSIGSCSVRFTVTAVTEAFVDYYVDCESWIQVAVAAAEQIVSSAFLFVLERSSSLVADSVKCKALISDKMVDVMINQSGRESKMTWPSPVIVD